MLFSKKALGPVVAMALLLVVAVSGVVGFQTWYQTYQSGLMSDVEESSSSTFDGFTFEAVSNDNLYLKSSVADNLSSFKIVDESGNEMCSFSGTGDVNSTGLVGHWKFNDDSSVIEDLSGNGNNGTLYGNSRLLLNFDDGTATDLTAYGNDGTLQNGVDCSGAGVSGQGCSFDGVDDEIEISTHNLHFGNFTDFSISLWANVNELSGNQNILHIGDSNHYIRVTLANNNFDFALRRGTTNASIESIESEFNISTNSWYHISAIADRDNSLKLYLNGNLIGTNSNPSDYINLTASSDPLVLGYWPVANTFYLNGSIDEVGVYSKALSSSEVTDLYNSQKANFIEFKDSKLDKSVEFDGVDDYIDLNLSQDNLNLTWSLLVKSSKVSTVLGTLHASAGDNDAGIRIMTNRISLSDNTVSPLQYLDLPSSNLDNSIYHILLRANGTLAEVFVDGFLVDSEDISSLIGLQPTRSILIGYQRRTPVVDWFEGAVEEFRIYNRSLSNQEVENLYWYSIKSQETGVNTIDVTSCNLVKGSRYNFVSFTNENKVDSYFIAK